MKLSEYKNEDAIELLGEIIEPVTKVMGDSELKEILSNQSNKNKKLTVVSFVLKKHKSEVIEILAKLDGKKVDEYECNIFTLPMKVMEILNDEELQLFFKSQVDEIVKEGTGSAMANTEEEPSKVS